jgi:hypothetical protein
MARAVSQAYCWAWLSLADVLIFRRALGLFFTLNHPHATMAFAHLKRILRLGRLRLRGPNGAKDEFLLAATAQNLRKLAKLIPLPVPILAT